MHTSQLDSFGQIKRNLMKAQYLMQVDELDGLYISNQLKRTFSCKNGKMNHSLQLHTTVAEPHDIPDGPC